MDPASLLSLVDTSLPSFWLAVLCITFNPLFWNCVGRFEHSSHALSTLFKSKYTACYVFAAVVFSLGLVRDAIFTQAVAAQPQWPPLASPAVQLTAAACMVLGATWVASSMLVLGITGTYLGDYFGILMSARVTGFPFNMVANPMYHGSTLLFLGYALGQASAAGVLLSAWVWFVYMVALWFEEPFTARIYRDRGSKAE
ncbi:Phosphatidyl-N-methylethanolamine N-methyltransferase [Entophlyctis luteolus]|nr:Phosphatidyl-N-methylethanolamine N-methyltransferase [Entophlyctis luteolus]